MNIELTTAEKIYILRRRTGLKQDEFGIKAFSLNGLDKFTRTQALRKQGKIEAGLYEPTFSELEKIAEVFNEELDMELQASDFLPDDKEEPTDLQKYARVVDKYPFILDYLNGIYSALLLKNKTLVNNMWEHIIKDLKVKNIEGKLGKAKSPVKDMSHVLIVDDDVNYISSLSDMLEKDFRVIPCLSGQDAIDLLNPKVKIVVLDIRMPYSGLDVAQKIIKQKGDVKIIFNTGYPGDYNQSEIEDSYKPFGYATKDNCDSLLKLIESADESNRTII